MCHDMPMTTPDFVLELRRSIGHAPLPLVGATAVVVRDGEVLLGRRSDNGAVAPISGIVEPGEEPARAAERETLEEAGIVAVAERLVWVHTMPEVVYGNGDRVRYLDLTFRCRFVSGEPHPADGEASEVFWHPLAELDRVDGLESEDHRRRIQLAVADETVTRFER